MITKDNFKQALEFLGFENTKDIYYKKIEEFNCELKVDFKNEKLIYPEKEGLIVNERQTCNFKQAENFVVFECVYKLLNQGYSPKHIELEPKWKVGHGASGGRADILVKDNEKPLLIIECKTAGAEFKKAWDTTQSNPTQLFTYYVQVRSTKFISLYTSDFVDGKVTRNYYLINIQDIPEILENDKKLKSYEDSTSVDEIYKVWRDSYSKDSTTFGIFENNKPYEIGEAKPTTETLKNITSKDIQGKYHEFATILRQHNVSGRENAFDKLINLFLCKVTDEKKNPDDLNFYWKGKAYDNPFDFQDRLQHLYKIGMGEFLGDEITYIANNKIDEAFEVFKNKPNTTKDTIKDFVKQLKFFTNNDFAFIEVHNESLFHQNFEILLKVSKMIQDIKLTESEENQFLGDMFESFLDQGVKQSEGQFFTPMPIIKFIISSLPKLESPKVIDYACGAGHFLNEYSTLFKTKEEKKNVEIVGIEKEYRLSKVSKVSSFMYGSDIDIIYEDALKKSNKVKDDSFDVLIANPPYSVKGFLQTLSDEDRNSYELINSVDSKSYGKTGAIECFFIEKAKQILKKNAIAGIIVPSSILNKDTPKLYTKTREIILKHFDIIAIAEFGSGTFGKTGTNTVTLFLRRRSDTIDIASHYENMVNIWFECDLKSNETFKNSDLLETYCSYIEIDFAIYKTLLCENLNDKIFENETFKEYKLEFENSSLLNDIKKKKFFKELTRKEKDELEKKELIKFIKEIEKEKLYYFMLASSQENDVVIIKSPTETNEIKKFLGYEWGGRKGKEGIKYLSSSKDGLNDEIEEEELDNDDKRVLENLQGLRYINTPLYNPSNLDDSTKFNKIIRNNFESINHPISDDQKEFASKKKLIDLIEFSRVDFNKAINLTPKNFKPLKSKYEQYKMQEIFIEIKNGKNVKQIDDVGKYRVSRIESISKGVFDITATKWTNSEVKINNLLQYGDILFSHINSVKHLGKTAFFESEESIVHGINLLRFRPNEKIIIPKFVFELLNMKNFTDEIKAQAQKAVNQASVNVDYLTNLKLPVPPLNIQQQIVKKCENVDKEVLKAINIIQQTEKDIENEVFSINDVDRVSLENISISISSGLTPLRSNSRFWNNGTVSWLKTEQLGKKYIYETNEKISEIALKETSIKINQKNSLSIAMYGEGRTRGSISILKEEMTTNQACCNVYLDEKKANYEYVYQYLKTQYNNLRSLASGVRKNLNTSHIKNYKIPLPSLKIQKQIVEKIEKLETKISEAQKTIDTSKEKKEEILKKYLN